MEGKQRTLHQALALKLDFFPRPEQHNLDYTHPPRLQLVTLSENSRLFLRQQEDFIECDCACK